jgi:transposase
MPRAPLVQIDPNSRIRKELTPYIRGQIIGRHHSGISKSQISRDLQIPRTTVIETIQRESQLIDGKTTPRSGRPKSYTERDSRHILTIIKADPFVTYSTIRERTGLEVSRFTFLRIIQESGYGHWKAQKRPKLEKEHAQKRLEWA